MHVFCAKNLLTEHIRNINRVLIWLSSGAKIQPNTGGHKCCHLGISNKGRNMDESAPNHYWNPRLRPKPRTTKTHSGELFKKRICRDSGKPESKGKIWIQNNRKRQEHFSKMHRVWPRRKICDGSARLQGLVYPQHRVTLIILKDQVHVKVQIQILHDGRKFGRL